MRREGRFWRDKEGARRRIHVGETKNKYSQQIPLGRATKQNKWTLPVTADRPNMYMGPLAGSDALRCEEKGDRGILTHMLSFLSTHIDFLSYPSVPRNTPSSQSCCSVPPSSLPLPLPPSTPPPSFLSRMRRLPPGLPAAIFRSPRMLDDTRCPPGRNKCGPAPEGGREGGREGGKGGREGGREGGRQTR
jgi:hypothetical protein